MHTIIATLLETAVLGSGVITADTDYQPKPLPEHLQACAEEAIADLAVSDGSTEAIWSLFKKHVDQDGLGRLVWKRDWKNGDDTWRETAIRLYVELLVRKTKQVKGAATVKSITTRLADRPDRGANEGNGLWHIVFNASLTDGRNISAGALVTDQCKVVELQQGVWIGNLISAAEVDAALAQ